MRPTRSRLPRLLVAAIAAVGAVLALTAAGAAARATGDGSGGSGAEQGPHFGIRLVDVPSDQADDPRARQYIVDHLAPGDSLQRRVEVGNDTGGPLDVDLYAGAAVIDGGRMRFAEGRTGNALTSWTRIEPAALELEAGERAEARVTVDVPAGAREGEHYAVVWAEVAGERSSGIRSVHRVGVRTYLSVGHGSEPHTDFEIRSLAGGEDGSGDPVVTAEVVNTGGRAVDLAGELRLDDGPASLTADPYDIEVNPTLAPGDRHTLTVPLDPDLPGGTWHAALTLRSGTVERHAEGTVELPAVDERARALPGGEDPATSSAGAGLAAGTVAGAVLVALVTLAGLLWVAWTRRREREPARTA